MSNQSKGKKFRERLDFKFVFHVSKVPQSGWEKLYVSLESVETGKTTAKTAKSLVQGGTCRWPDAIIESTRLVHNTRNSSYDAKLYRFIVGMSPTRVLGEITLNLADYVTTTSAITAAFPLKSCSAGSVLHIKLQCLTSADSSEQEKSAEQNGHVNGVVSEDEGDDAASVNSAGLNLPPPTPNKERSLPRYNSDSSEASTPLATNGKKPARLSLPNLATRQSMEGKLQLADAESRREATAKLELEQESLKQQLGELTSQLRKKDEEITVLTAERDKMREDGACFKQEEEDKRSNLQSELEAVRNELDNERHVSVGALAEHEARMKDYERLVRELQDALLLEKDARQSLETDVRQSQDSRVQLAATVKELEKCLMEERTRLEGVSVKNMELQTSLMEQEQTSCMVEQALMEKLQYKEQELRAAEERCSEMQGIDLKEVDELRKEVEELEVDIRELTDENMDLIFKLNVANKELTKHTGEPHYFDAVGVEEKLRKFHEEHEKLVVLESSNRELKAAKAELEAKLKSSAEEMQALKNDLKASRSMHGMDREAFSGRELRLKERADELHEKHSMTYELVAKLQTELEALNKENSENRRRKDELEAAVNSMDMSKTEFTYRMAELESEVLKSRSIARKFESELAEKSQELKIKMAKINDLESNILMLHGNSNELENRLQELQSRDMQSTSRIVDLEIQISSARRQVENLDVKKQELESRVDSLELEKYDLGNTLRTGQEDNKFLKEKLEGIIGELAESNAQLEVEVAARSASEKKVTEFGSAKAGLEKQVNYLEDENWHLNERIAGLEAQLNYLTEERDGFRQQNMELNEEKSGLTASTAQYEAKIYELELELSETRKQQEESSHARTILEKQIEDLKLESVSAKETSSRELETLEESCQKLRTVCEVAESKLADAERQLARRAEEVEKVVLSRTEAEDRARKAEELVQRAQAERSLAVERLQAQVHRLSEEMDATCDEKERLASQALIEASELRAQKLEWEDQRQEFEERLKQCEVDNSGLQEAVDAGRERESGLRLRLDDATQRTLDLEASASSAASESDAKVAKLENELSELAKNKNELEEKAGVEHQQLQEEKAELETKVSELNTEISQLRNEIQQLRESSESFQEKVESLEKEQAANQAREVEHRCESIKLRRQNSEMKQKMSEQEREREELRKKLEQLDGDGRRRRDENGAKIGNGVLRSLSKANVRFEVRNNEECGLLRERVKTLEHELKLKTAEAEKNSMQRTQSFNGAAPNSLELLQTELQRLQQVNKQLEEKLSRFKETSKFGNTLERVASLENELAEALESNVMYKEQLRSAFATQANVHAAALQNLGDVDQVVRDLLSYKRKCSEVESELAEMRERYLDVSLKFAEVEVERAELVMTVRSLKNGRKP